MESAGSSPATRKSASGARSGPPPPPKQLGQPKEVRPPPAELSKRPAEIQSHMPLRWKQPRRKRWVTLSVGELERPPAACINKQLSACPA